MAAVVESFTAPFEVMMSPSTQRPTDVPGHQSSAPRPTGLSAVGPRSWGTHFCHFYETEEDLAEILVPFFRSGLEAHERCLWVASEPLDVDQARGALRVEVPDLEKREAEGQIEFVSVQEWYERNGSLGPEEVLEAWIRRAERARAEGFEGLRITGNTYWLKREQWDDFVGYEAMVAEAFREQPILALCSYCLGRCDKKDVMDVFGTHDFALVPREGRVEKLESPVLHHTREALAEQRESATVRDRLLGVLGHDLKNPLNVITLAAEELLASGEPRYAQLGSRIKSNARRMGRMVEDLLDYARGDLGEGIPIQRSRLYLDDLCRAVLEEVSVAHPDRRVELVCEGPVLGLWDSDRLRQAVTNLLTNALQHGEDPVRIRLRPAPGQQLVEVSNRGAPIPEEERPRLFEPFYRREAARRRSQGLGLGLYIVRQIAEAHGGRVEVQSSDAETVFRLRLPRAARRR